MLPVTAHSSPQEAAVNTGACGPFDELPKNRPLSAAAPCAEPLMSAGKDRALVLWQTPSFMVCQCGWVAVPSRLARKQAVFLHWGACLQGQPMSKEWCSLWYSLWMVHLGGQGGQEAQAYSTVLQQGPGPQSRCAAMDAGSGHEGGIELSGNPGLPSQRIARGHWCVRRPQVLLAASWLLYTPRTPTKLSPEKPLVFSLRNQRPRTEATRS